MSDRLRLLAIIEAYDITGPAKNLFDFALRARAQGVDTTIATFVRGAPSNVFTEAARSREIPLELIAERGAYDRGVTQSLREVMARVRPNVVQTHAVKSHFLARLAGLPGQAPWAAFHHGYTWPSLRARMYNQLDRWSLRTARRVFTVSEPFRDQLTAAGVPRSRIQVIHNAIPLDWGKRRPEEAARLRESLGIAPDRLVLLIVGRLSKEKDHVTLLQAIASLRPDLPLHLVVVGEGLERPRIQAEIERLGLTGSVTLTGQQPSAEPYYGVADLAVLSSLSEGSPNALLEAMSAGVPAVSTSVGGVPEIVTHGESAWLVKPGDGKGMAEGIAAVLKDAALAGRLVKKSRELVRDRHSPEGRVRRLVDSYREMIRS